MSRIGTVVTPHQGSIRTDLGHWLRALPSGVVWETPRGGQIARQRNLGAAKGLDGEWVLFLDSDSVPRPDTLPRLLDQGTDLLSAVICEKMPPWALCAMEGPVTAEGIHKVDLSLLPREGVRRITAAGAGCLLVRRRVFEQVPFPWFQCGQITPDLLHEDTGFCLAAARVGIPTFLHCGVRVGHDFGGGVVWPGVNGQPYLEWPNGVMEPAPHEVDRLRVRSGVEIVAGR